MTQSQHLVLIDTRSTSLADSFADDGRFLAWLKSYSNVEEALSFLSRLPRGCSTDVYLSEENLSARISMDGTNPMARSLVETFDELEAIGHITVFCPKTRFEVDPRALNGVSRRLLNRPCSEFTLPARICSDGISYLNDRITLHRDREETHLIHNVQDNIEQLLAHLDDIFSSQNQILNAWQEDHSNKLGVPPF
jgi:hypothetical protein